MASIACANIISSWLDWSDLQSRSFAAGLIKQVLMAIYIAHKKVLWEYNLVGEHINRQTQSFFHLDFA